MKSDPNDDQPPSPGESFAAPGGSIVHLQLTGDQFALEVTTGANAKPTTLEIGSMQRLLKILAHEPASATELEAAISEIEDMLTPAIRAMPTQAQLVAAPVLFDPLLKALGRVRGLTTHLEVSMVEEVFGRLVSLAHGTPASLLEIPESRNFAATVLVLRELMHHAGIPTVLCQTHT